MNSNLKWQTADERGTARNAKAIRQAAGIPTSGEYISQIVRTSNAPDRNAGNSTPDVNDNRISKDRAPVNLASSAACAVFSRRGAR